MKQNETRRRFSLRQFFQRDGGIRLSDVRGNHWPYYLAYAFELLLFSFRGHYFSFGVSLFGLSGRTVAMAAHGIASLAVMLLWKPRFRPLVRASVFVTAAGFLPFFFLPAGTARFFFGVLAYAGLGGAVTAARCGFAFAANNAERLLGMGIMFCGTSVIRCFTLPETVQPLAPQLIGTALLFGLCVCLLRFREESFTVKEKSDAADKKGLYWALAYFIAYFAVDGYLWAALEYTGRTADTVLFAGLTAAALIGFAVMLVFRWNVLLLWNVFFVAAAAAALLIGFFPVYRSVYALNFVCGVSVLGWPLCIYMLACAQGYFADYRLLKQCTVVFVLVSPLANFTDDLVENHFPQAVPFVSMLVLLGVVLILLLLSPYSYRQLFFNAWARQLQAQKKPGGEPAAASAADPFAPYGLTPRQREVAGLLLEAKTRRQIAGELGLSESTVKTHTSELYKKLNINSRAELFRLFGAPAAPEPEE